MNGIEPSHTNKATLNKNCLFMLMRFFLVQIFANVRHYLYQHSWIVTGAKFGWWHGAEALRKLIAVDRIAQQRWGIGKKSELVARKALVAVEAKTR